LVHSAQQYSVLPRLFRRAGRAVIKIVLTDILKRYIVTMLI
jgi:hypothetical protein